MAAPLMEISIRVESAAADDDDATAAGKFLCCTNKCSVLGRVFVVSQPFCFS